MKSNLNYLDFNFMLAVAIILMGMAIPESRPRVWGTGQLIAFIGIVVISLFLIVTIFRQAVVNKWNWSLGLIISLILLFPIAMLVIIPLNSLRIIFKIY